MNERQAVDEIIAQEKLWSNGSIVLYHVTSEDNALSILENGVSPAFSKGKMGASWYVSKPGVLWAIAHTSLRHDLPATKLIVFTCMLPMLVAKRSGIRHAFYTRQNIVPEHFAQAEYFIYREGLGE